MRAGAAALLWVGAASVGCGGLAASPTPRAVVAVDAMVADAMVGGAMVGDAIAGDPDAMPADAMPASAVASDATVADGDDTDAMAGDAIAMAPPAAAESSPEPPDRPASLELQVRAVSGATAEPLLRPVVFELRETLARCRGASAVRRVVVEATIEPFGGRARAWMTWPDKRNLTVEQWAAVQPVGQCVADAIGERRWPRPGDGMPAAFEVELRWR